MINASKVVKLCSDKTNFLSHDSIMQRHVKWTGDADGVLINNGVYAGHLADLADPGPKMKAPKGKDQHIEIPVHRWILFLDPYTFSLQGHSQWLKPPNHPLLCIIRLGEPKLSLESLNSTNVSSCCLEVPQKSINILQLCDRSMCM